MINLRKLLTLTTRDYVKDIRGAMSFDEYEPNYVSSIVVKTYSDMPVRILLDGVIIEVGIPVDGVYHVESFSATPFPYGMFPLLDVRCDVPYTLDFTCVEYDVIIQQAIYQIGAYYKMKNGSFVLFKENCMTVSHMSPDSVKFTKTDVNKTHVAIECQDFDRIVESVRFSWMAPFVMPNTSKRNFIIAYTQLGVEPEIPCVLIEKEKADELIAAFRSYYPKFRFEMSKKTPDEILRNNKEFLKIILKYWDKGQKKQTRIKYDRQTTQELRTRSNTPVLTAYS